MSQAETSQGRVRVPLLEDTLNVRGMVESLANSILRIDKTIRPKSVKHSTHSLCGMNDNPRAFLYMEGWGVSEELIKVFLLARKVELQALYAL